MHVLKLRALAAAAATVGALAVAPASANAAYWVGLGDSFAAGPLIPSQTLNPLGCLRSTRNYARLASTQLGVSLKDASCSGAETAEMTTSQETYAGTNPPQLNAIAADTRVVSLQIGGNDIGFTEILTECQTANPFGHPCQDKYVRGDHDELRGREPGVVLRRSQAPQRTERLVGDQWPSGERITEADPVGRIGGRRGDREGSDHRDRSRERAQITHDTSQCFGPVRGSSASDDLSNWNPCSR